MSSTSPCPALTEDVFKHLVFVFASSAIADCTSFWCAAGWSEDVDDASTYTRAATAMASLTDELKVDAEDNPLAQFECKPYYRWHCERRESKAAEEEEKDDKKSKDTGKGGD